MTTKLITFLVLAATVPGSGVWAQAVDDVQADVTNEVPAVAPSSLPDANQTIYVPSLPSAQELTNAAAVRGVAIARITQSDSSVIVSYSSTNGAVSTVAYQILPAAQAGVAQAVALPTTPAPVVVYQPAPRVVYYYPDRGYYPDYCYYPGGYWYSPVSLSIGFGYGFRGGYHGYGRGGFHRGFRSHR